MSDSVRPHRRQPTGLPRPWDSPGKNTGVGCHFLLQCMRLKSESEVAQSCPTLRTPWTAAHQSPPSMGFSRQEYWSGVPSSLANTNLLLKVKVIFFMQHYPNHSSTSEKNCQSSEMLLHPYLQGLLWAVTTAPSHIPCSSCQSLVPAPPRVRAFG